MEVAEFIPDIPGEQPVAGFELLPEIAAAGVAPGFSVEKKRTDPGWDEEVTRAVQAAYLKGVQKGLDETEFWKQRAVNEAVNLFQSLRSARDSMQDQVMKDLLRLAVEIAGKVIKHEVDRGVVQCLRDQIEACVLQIEREVPVQLRLNPADLMLVEEILSGDENLGQILRGIRLLEDRRVQRGGCIMETERGILKATIDGQLEKLAGALETEYGKMADH